MYPDQQQLSENHPHYADWSSLQLDFSEFLSQDITLENAYHNPESIVSGGGFDFDFDTVLASTTAPCEPPPPTTTDNISTFPETFSSSTQPPTTTPKYFPTTAESAATPADPSHSDWYGLNHFTPPPSVTATVSSSKTTSPVVSTTKPASISPALTDNLDEPSGESRKRKRERNTEAARRYRQRRQDRLDELEEALAAMTKDRDELRIKLARSEAEADVLRGLVGKK